MDISKLSHGAKLIIGGTVAFLIVSIFNWQEVDISGIASVGRSMWHGWGVLAGLLAIGLLVWEVIRLANINVAMPRHAGDDERGARRPARDLHRHQVPRRQRVPHLLGVARPASSRSRSSSAPG